MPSPGFEPTIPATKRSQTYALDRAATGIGIRQVRLNILNIFHFLFGLQLNNLHILDKTAPRILYLQQIQQFPKQQALKLNGLEYEIILHKLFEYPLPNIRNVEWILKIICIPPWWWRQNGSSKRWLLTQYQNGWSPESILQHCNYCFSFSPFFNLSLTLCCSNTEVIWDQRFLALLNIINHNTHNSFLRKGLYNWKFNTKFSIKYFRVFIANNKNNNNFSEKCLLNKTSVLTASNRTSWSSG
jgi:hypothetical protein